jgi:hypothetical protein
MLSSRVANYTNNPAYTVPIASPTVHIATQAANLISTSAPIKVGTEMDVSKNDLGAAGTEKAETSKPLVSQPAVIADPGAQTAAVDSNSMHAPSTHDSLNVASKSLEIVEEFVPRKGQASAKGATHNSLENTVNQLDYQGLMQLQIYNISLAAKLQQNLREALAAHQARETFIGDKQATLRGLLCTAIAEEHDHMANSKNMHDRFYRDMTEACKQDGDEKSATQLEATEHLKALADLSQKASLERANIDKYRDEIQALESTRANSRNTYSKAVHDVLMRALGSEAAESDANAKKQVVATPSNPAKTHTASKTTKSTTKASSSKSNSPKHRQDNAVVTPPKNAQQITQHAVFERRSETAHQSIREVLDGVNVAEELDGFVQVTRKKKSKSQKKKRKEAARPTSNSVEDKTTQN